MIYKQLVEYFVNTKGCKIYVVTDNYLLTLPLLKHAMYRYGPADAVFNVRKGLFSLGQNYLDTCQVIGMDGAYRLSGVRATMICSTNALEPDVARYLQTRLSGANDVAGYEIVYLTEEV